MQGPAERRERVVDPGGTTGWTVVLAPTLTPWLVQRYGNARVIFGGLLSGLAAYALFVGIGMDWSYAAMLPSMLLIGLMFAFVYGPLTIVATEGIAEDEQGLAGGLLNSAFQFGAALGLSMVTAVSVAALGDATSPEAGLSAIRTTLLVPLAATAVAALIMATGLRRRPPTPAAESGEADEPVTISA
ncbi:MFS transporter [Nonomuraea aurantiaca]|uniref:MFS transporter n=1 Tax=Nonomuraea aurantiaca TaxID=2878562 RepID=UPI001CD99AA0|nr:MFS transporter [Nonomuraea aurantiaca]MCA2229084.1 MFS transporter [Nonomuraea aurantiaca]